MKKMPMQSHEIKENIYSYKKMYDLNTSHLTNPIRMEPLCKFS